MSDLELAKLSVKLGMSAYGHTRDEILSKILTCAVKVG